MFSSVFSDISLWQLGLVVAVALIASIIGGVAGYGSGALMPLVLVPLLGPEPVVPIIAMSAMVTNTSRMLAFLRHVRWRQVLIVLAGAIVPCVFSAYGYTLLTTKGALIVIGTMLMLTVPLRRAMRRRQVVFGDRGLLGASVGYGAAVGGTIGSGVILLSILMAAGLQSVAVIATDAAISIVIGMVRTSVFGIAGALTPQTLAFALLIGGVAFPGAFLAKAFVEAMPVKVHTSILDAVVLVGGGSMLVSALMR